MSDAKRYERKRAERDAEFGAGFEAGYQEFKVGVLLRQGTGGSGLDAGRAR